MLLRPGLRGGVLALFSLVGLAACGSDRIVLELQGSIPGAKRVDVTLLEPVVLAKLQRRPTRDGTTPAMPSEKVFYMAQRSTVGFPLDGAALDGLQFEVADSGGAYVPLVVVRDDQGVLGMGIYNPDSVSSAEIGSEHRPDAVEPVGDVTIYPIHLEAAKGLEANPSIPSPVLKGEVMVVRCKPQGPISGAVWRRSDDKELRVLLPLADDKQNAVDRLDAPDLDCDEHSPGPVGLLPRGEGDKLDCDDTAFLVNAKQVEACSTFDEDCNPLTTFSQKSCQCAATGGVCACEDGPPICPELGHNQKCDVPSKTSGAGRAPCDSRGDLLALPDCVAGCTVTLVSVPEGWNVVIGNDRGLNEPLMQPPGVKVPIGVRATSTPSTGTSSSTAFLSVRPAGMTTSSVYGIRLVLTGTNDACDAAGLITCVAQ